MTQLSAVAPPSPLEHINVLDLSRILAGPWATQNLADLGATVIKIEKPISGDDTRHWGPPFATDINGSTDTAAYFFCCNRCADGHVMLAIGNDAQFAAFCQAAECKHLVSDQRFMTNAARVQHRRELLTELEPALCRRTCAEWTALGDELNFPCGPINTEREASVFPAAVASC